MAEVDQYDYELPEELIAQRPLARRVDARLLVVQRQSGEISHAYVRDLPGILHPHDGLVLNDTRVVPATLHGFRAATGGHWQGLFLSQDPGGTWRILCKARGKLKPLEKITLLDREMRPDVSLALMEPEAGGVWIAQPLTAELTINVLERVGRVPLPPYIRKGQAEEGDREHYQTVFAKRPGAVAAPTAGLHFSDSLLQEITEHGVQLSHVTLHVGLGTFRPITAERLADHVMHREWAEITQATVNELATVRASGGRIVCVGTTAVRVLETAAQGGQLRPWRGETDLFIRPPYQFRAVDVLLTNFHLPRSTLLILVRTFGGDELIRRAYAVAIEKRYRFYSYGDAMLIL